MKWAESIFKERLFGLTFDIPTGCGGSISTTAVENIKGDANISCSRGKRRHLVDVSPEVKSEVDGDTPAAVREVFDAFVKPAGQGLQPLLLAEIQKLVEEYKQK